jgi:hypothetical protein
LCVVVVLVGVVFVAGVELVFGVELVVLEDGELPPPHPATARVLASTASSVRMAVSGVLLTGRAPVVVARGLGGSPYQGLAAPDEPQPRGAKG